VWPGVSGKAPWTYSGVIWVAAVVCSEVVFPKPLRHESVGSKVAVKQTNTCHENSYQKWSHKQSTVFLTNTTAFPVVYVEFSNLCQKDNCKKTVAKLKTPCKQDQKRSTTVTSNQPYLWPES